MKKKLLITALLLHGITYAFAASLTLQGYAWSDTIGWISLTCETGGNNGTNICGTSSYKVTLDNNYYLSGYAWSDNLGWISFNENAGCPAAPCRAQLHNDSITGWARVVSPSGTTLSSNGGWDGWISLDTQNGYGGVRATSSLTGWQLSGYAWGDLITGWISFAQSFIACEENFSWSKLLSQCIETPTATIEASPDKISYGRRSTLTWGSTHAESCTPLGPWSNGGALSGSGLTDPLTSSQLFQYYCSASGVDSSIALANVTVCPQSLPVLYNDACNAAPRVVEFSISGQYTPNGVLSVSCTNSTSFVIKRNGTTYSTVQGQSGHVNITDNGLYSLVCRTPGDDGIYESSVSIMDYQTTPPPPIVTLRASPTTLSPGDESVLSWDVTFPGSVQVPPRTCTLTASPVCANGNCTQAQTDDASALNQILSSGRTDANDLGGANRLISAAINTVVNGNVVTGETDWRAFGKKTVTIGRTTDFILSCGGGAKESQTVRVKITSSTEN
jgi:hypothetical protein